VIEFNVWKLFVVLVVALLVLGPKHIKACLFAREISAAMPYNFAKPGKRTDVKP